MLKTSTISCARFPGHENPICGPHEDRMRAVTWLPQTGLALVLLLGSLANPVMACLQRGTSIKPAEQACCKQMRSMCAPTGMAAHHSCCRTTAYDSELLVPAANPSSPVTPECVFTTATEQPYLVLASLPAARASSVSPSPPPSLSSLQTFRV